MGFLTRLSPVVAPARSVMNVAVASGGDPFESMYGAYRPPMGASRFGGISPELALTLSHVYCAVATISDDFGVMSCQFFEDLGVEGSRRVQYNDAAIGSLAYKLRWQPNSWQSAKGFWSTLAWQYLLRPAAYAEIVYRPNAPHIIDQVVPRTPDRVFPEPLSNGRLRYKIIDPGGMPRWVNLEDMLVVRNTSMDGLNALGRLDYGGPSMVSALALQDFTRNFFRKGVTGALAVTYKGAQWEEEEEAALHARISRYISGVENAGGVLLIPEDIDTKALGVNPEQAQLLGLKNLGGRDVARMFKMPASKLKIEGTASDQDNKDYVNHCQLPIAVEFEQAIQRDLIVAPRFHAKFNMDYLMRSSQKERMESYEIGIRARVMRPSEARIKEDLPPDPALDRLSEQDYRPGTPRGSSGGTGTPGQAAAAAQTRMADRYRTRALQIAEASARRLVRRETAAIATAAKKHAKDREAFLAWAADFYTQHEVVVAEALGLSAPDANAYCGEQLLRLQTRGVADTQTWEQDVAPRLVERAVTGDVDEAA